MRKNLFLTFFILIAGLVSAEDVVTNFNPYDNWPALEAGAAKTGEGLKIYYFSASPDVGVKNLYSWWGHAAIVVERYDLSDRANPRWLGSTSYDYGIFSMGDEDFAKNFIQGRLNFLVGSSNAKYHQTAYVHANRSIVLQELDFLPEVKWQIAKFLEMNAEPENHIYLYHHYNNNCATILRDIIDVATGGQLASTAKAIPARMTIRDHARRSMRGSYLVDFMLNFLQGGVIDRPVTVWEEMYLPAEIKDFIADFKYTDKNGVNRKLVKTVIPKALPEAVPFLDKDRRANSWILSLLAGLGFGFLGAFLLSKGNKMKFFRVVGGLYYALFYFFLFIMGFVLFYMMTFTDHDVTYNNMNIAFINPGVILLFVFSIMYAAGSKKGRILLIVFSLAFALAAISALVLNLVGVVDQDNVQIIAFALPFYLLSGLGSFFKNLIPVRKRK
ncbi:MAG: DUF4105 domain-containing protein [Spirochaetales bacterium]|nr:DUF4105 domain-containing protein [Spirochaetales bacterium]